MKKIVNFVIIVLFLFSLIGFVYLENITAFTVFTRKVLKVFYAVLIVHLLSLALKKVDKAFKAPNLPKD